MGVDVDHYRRVAEQMAGKPGAINNSAAAVLMLQLCDLFERRWIPVSERLPEEGVDVLVASPCPNSSTPNIDIASWGSEGEQEPVWRESDCGRIYPTNWMPLPEPPEVK